MASQNQKKDKKRLNGIKTLVRNSNQVFSVERTPRSNNLLSTELHDTSWAVRWLALLNLKPRRIVTLLDIKF